MLPHTHSHKSQTWSAVFIKTFSHFSITPPPLTTHRVTIPPWGIILNSPTTPLTWRSSCVWCWKQQTTSCTTPSGSPCPAGMNCKPAARGQFGEVKHTTKTQPSYKSKSIFNTSCCILWRLNLSLQHHFSAIYYFIFFCSESLTQPSRPTQPKVHLSSDNKEKSNGLGKLRVPATIFLVREQYMCRTYTPYNKLQFLLHAATGGCRNDRLFTF